MLASVAAGSAREEVPLHLQVDQRRCHRVVRRNGGYRGRRSLARSSTRVHQVGRRNRKVLSSDFLGHDRVLPNPTRLEKVKIARIFKKLKSIFEVLIFQITGFWGFESFPLLLPPIPHDLLPEPFPSTEQPRDPPDQFATAWTASPEHSVH